VNGRLDLTVLHLPPEEVVPFGRVHQLPEAGFRAADFGAYYGLFGNPAETPLPRFTGDGAERGAVQVAFGGAAARDRAAFGGTAYTCLTGAGKPKEGGG